MTLLISLLAAELFLLLCAKPLKKRPAVYYGAAALVSAAVTGLYWAAPEGISPATLNKLPLWLGALGTACFIEVMAVGALPGGHPMIKRTMPIRGELSIFACLLTLGQNLSYGKNYFVPGYLLSGPVSATKTAAWISLVMIALMLVLTVTSIKAVRRKFSPKRWKALQRWAYLFYALIYVHVLLMNVPGFLKGRSSCGWTLLAYSAVFLSYAVCRVRKAVLMGGGKGARVTGLSQLAAAGIGAAAALALTAGLYFSIPDTPAAAAAPQAPEVLSQGVEELTPKAQPEPEPSPETDAVPESEQNAQPETEAAEPVESSEEEALPAPEPEPAAASKSEPESDAAPVPEAEPVQEAEPEAAPEPEPEPEPEPAFQYRDGTFTGSGEGYYGTVTVSVTIASDVITSVSIVSYIDDDDYFGDAQSGIVPAILSAQSADVSAVSGATYSSKGIIAAVRDALSQAEN